MKGSIGWIVWAALLITGCAGFPGKLEPLNVTLSEIVPTQMGLMEQEYAVKLRVQNTNRVDVPLAGVSYVIELNGKTFAKGVGKADTTVPAFGDVVVEGRAFSSLSGIINQFVALSEQAPDKFTYRVRGRLTATDGRSIPFDQTGEISLSAPAEDKP